MSSNQRQQKSQNQFKQQNEEDFQQRYKLNAQYLQLKQIDNVIANCKREFLEREIRLREEEQVKQNQLNHKHENQENLLNHQQNQIQELQQQNEETTANLFQEKLQRIEEQENLRAQLDIVNNNQKQQILEYQQLIEHLFQQKDQQNAQFQDLSLRFANQTQDFYNIISQNFQKSIDFLESQQNCKEDLKKFSNSNEQISQLLNTLQQNLEQNQFDDQLGLELERQLNQVYNASQNLISSIKNKQQQGQVKDAQMDKVIQYYSVFSSLILKIKDTFVRFIYQFNKQQQQMKKENEKNRELVQKIKEIILENSNQIKRIDEKLNKAKDDRNSPDQIIKIYKEYVEDNTSFINQLRQESSNILEKVNQEILQLFQIISNQMQQLSKNNEELNKDFKDLNINQFDKSSSKQEKKINTSLVSSLLGFQSTFYNTANVFQIIQANKNILINKYGQNNNICSIRYPEYLDNIEQFIVAVKQATQICYFKNQKSLKTISSPEQEKNQQ